MTTTSLYALRLASSFLPPRTFTRTLRLDTKRSIYLSSAMQKKKKKSKVEAAASVTNTPPPNNLNTILQRSSVQEPRGIMEDAVIDADDSIPDFPIPDVYRELPGPDGHGRETSPRPSTLKIESLMSVIRTRREQAARTILFSPDLHSAANPCPRYMRHKIESHVGRVRHVAWTSLVSSLKTDVQGLPLIPGQHKTVVRKSLMVEFQNDDQMNLLIRDFTQPFPNDKATHNNRLLYCHGRWSQSSDQDSSVDLNAALNSSANISEQVKTLLARTELDDAGIRARFFLCDLIESLIKAIFPGCYVIPFGSTISGLGRSDSDMDVVLRLPHNETKLNRPFSAFSSRSSDMTDARAIVVKQLTLVHEILRCALPGYCEFTRIFRANVPIVTFKHSYTNLCCDLSVQSTDSILAAQLFNTYTQLDPRVRPLLFAIRRWSIAQNLSSVLTNFPLTCLTLFYLMEQKVVPPMNTLEGNTDRVTCIPTSIRWRSRNNSSSLEDLLCGFFQFYSEFDFARDAISVFLGKIREKVTTDMLEVENPLDRELNCARLLEHRNQYPAFQAAIRDAAKTLLDNRKPGGNDAIDWGLTCIVHDFKRETSVEVIADLGDEPDLVADGDIAGAGGLGGGLFNQRVPPRTVRGSSSPRGETMTKDDQVMSILTEIFESERDDSAGREDEGKFSLMSNNFLQDEMVENSEGFDKRKTASASGKEDFS